MTATMQDAKEHLREMEAKAQSLEYNLQAAIDKLKGLPAPGEITKLVEVRKKRQEAERRQQERNRNLQRDLERQAAEAQQDAPAAGAEAAAAAAAAAVAAAAEAEAPPADEEAEPGVAEVLSWQPRQALVDVDLSPLDLPGPSGDARAVLEELLASRMLMDYTGAYDSPRAAAAVLRVLFQVVSFDDQPFSALQALLEHYGRASRQDVGWVPQLTDFMASLTALGYQPDGSGSGASGSGSGSGRGRAAAGRKRSAAEASGAGDASASGQGAAGAAGGSGGAAGGSGGCGGAGGVVVGAGRGLVRNLQALLRLAAGVAEAHRQGRLDVGFGSAQQAAGKALLGAIHRLLRDPSLAPPLYPDLLRAHEALLAPWEPAHWPRVRADSAEAAAAAGPSHRAAVRLVAAATGFSPRARAWQQAAMMEVAERVMREAKPSRGSGGGGAGGRSEHPCIDVRRVLGVEASQGGARRLLEALTKDRKVDHWRLLSLLQAAFLVVFSAAHHGAHGPTDGDLAVELASWLTALGRGLEHCLRGRTACVLRAKVFLAEAAAALEREGGGTQFTQALP
ncbi:hypothetical protein HYH03_004014 [Edaphochlamys debaryana]|uniref:Uncharacterized protein n=1 Tax=Edaphochlamys debaryana TaxID=47281 RepID=A0A836C300_9CHLO|nr:hypothetical protein HYH03_004014 [Edaphochlamys debaryana]|eukprot:KAG2498265.1 hypothetical protein HYH03_004014 [Edaphochlamys debaryana]